MEPDMDHLCGSACVIRHTKCWSKCVTTKMVTKTFWTDGISTTDAANLCQILGGLSNVSFNTMKSHGKTIPTLQQDKKEVGTKNHGNFHWVQRYTRTIESAQGLLKRRSRHTKLYHEYTAITGSGNKPMLPGQQVRQRRDQQFEGLDEYDYRLEASAGWRYYPSSTTHSSSSSSSRWQPSTDLWSTWNWDSWKSSSWNTVNFFLL